MTMRGDEQDAALAPGWLAAALARAQAEVARWPAWKRAAMQAAVAPPPADRCRCKHRCDEAQTCVGGCVAAARTST